ncbi:fluoride efflux transporter FluC [Georgenia wangjunii]|uniref:fluoride efflux transporter FluC n=1 Tax=Georgenia wangjunii TaxID=3117730 RepID=UPI002F26D17A
MIAVLALAGGLGAVLRFVVDTLVRERLGARSTAGIALVNVTGSFALGVLTGLVTSVPAAGPVLALAGTGLLGGYTTFSTAMVDAVGLLREGEPGRAFATAVGTLTLSVLGALAGLALTG